MRAVVGHGETRQLSPAVEGGVSTRHLPDPACPCPHPTSWRGQGMCGTPADLVGCPTVAPPLCCLGRHRGFGVVFGDLAGCCGASGAVPHNQGCSPTAGAMHISTAVLFPPPTPQRPSLKPAKWEAAICVRGPGQRPHHLLPKISQRPAARLGRAAAAVTMLGCSGAEGRSRRGYELINAKQFWMASQAFFFFFSIFISASSKPAGIRRVLGLAGRGVAGAPM